MIEYEIVKKNYYRLDGAMMRSWKSYKTGQNLSDLLIGIESKQSLILTSLISLSSNCRDMQARVSLWCSLTGIGWLFPAREPLSKAELIEEERRRESILEARKFASASEEQVPCRSVRVLVGYKL
jgi:hypothetical protein